MVSIFRLSIKACVLAAIFLVGCSSGPSGEIGTKEWCESIKQMSSKDLEVYLGELNSEQMPEYGRCMNGMSE